VDIKDRACIDSQILDAQLGNSFQDHIEDKVAVAHVVVEGDGHAILQTNLLYGFLDGIQ
jgi:hypothetical protein